MKVCAVAQIHDSMVNPRIENLLSKVDSKFTLVSLGAQRARQINAYFIPVRIEAEEVAVEEIEVLEVVEAADDSEGE
jgi:DNA-directed RNA polymerase omega subunit